MKQAISISLVLLYEFFLIVNSLGSILIYQALNTCVELVIVVKDLLFHEIEFQGDFLR